MVTIEHFNTHHGIALPGTGGGLNSILTWIHFARSPRELAAAELDFSDAAYCLDGLS